MRKPRAAASPAPLPVLPKEYHDLARDKLQEDCLAFVAGTHGEDPKLFIGRLAAAAAAFDFLAKLRDAQVEAVAAEAPTQQQVIASARASIACENK
jgi:hypothetical protein